MALREQEGTTGRKKVNTPCTLYTPNRAKVYERWPINKPATVTAYSIGYLKQEQKPSPQRQESDDGSLVSNPIYKRARYTYGFFFLIKQSQVLRHTATKAPINKHTQYVILLRANFIHLAKGKIVLPDLFLMKYFNSGWVSMSLGAEP